MSNHDRGPFTVVDNDGCYVRRPEFATLRIEEYTPTNSELAVALIITDCPLAIAGAESLARLIVAAPDLLAELRKIEWGDCEECPCCSGGRYDMGHEEDCTLAAALAKADPPPT